MLVIRMQRSGRKGHAMFRVVVQDSRRTPTSGKLVAHLGSYDPHAKSITVDKEKAQFYLDHGAQPSERVTRILKAEGVKLPKWVTIPEAKQRTVRNADKRRSTRPEAPAEEAAETPEAATEAEPTTTTEPEVTETTEATTTPEPETAEEPVEAESKTPEAEEEKEAETAPVAEEAEKKD